VKRYIKLAWRDAKAKSPTEMSNAELEKAIARYEAAQPAAETAGKSDRRSIMAKAKGKKDVKTNGKAKGKKGKAAAAAEGNGRARTGVGATIRELIKKKPDTPNADIAAAALKAHPDSSTNAACVAWYKNDMRKKGEIKKAA
jgi:hypothetical protein